MLTLYAVPKPFRGHIDVIQRNALASWQALGKDCRIVLFGDEEGVAEAARAAGVEHVPEVARTPLGTPLLDDLIAQARRIARPRDVLCLVNADVVLPRPFRDAADIVAVTQPSFLAVGRCLNVDVSEPASPEEIERLPGMPRGHDFIDYFLYTPSLFHSVPAFAIGRAGFDNWLVWKAKDEGAAVVDLSPFVLARHQNHDYGHVPGGVAFTYGGAEAAANRRLAGRHLRSMLDATHVLTSGGEVRRNWQALGQVHSRYHRLRMKLAGAKARLG